MPAKQNAKGTWNVVKKDGSLGKRNFSTKKNALAAQRSPKKGAKKPKAKAKGKSTAVTATGSRAPGTGRSYQAGRATALILAPATHQVIGVVVKGRSPTVAGDQLVTTLKSRAHATHQAINVADIIIDRSRMVGQAAALSRGSVTAWLPEGYILGKGVADVLLDKLPADVVHNRFVGRQTGWAPLTDNWNPSRARMYRILKHGGQGVRIAASRIKIINRAKRALQELILRPVGATL